MRQSAFVILGDRNVEVFETPFELTLQTRVILDNQESLFRLSHLDEILL
jgi:hypothetical protein